MKETNIRTTLLEDMLGLAPETSAQASEDAMLPDLIQEKNAAISAISSARAGKDNFEVAQENIKEVIAKALFAVDKLTELTVQTESARIFEVLAGMVKTVVDGSSVLVELELKRKREETNALKAMNAMNKPVVPGAPTTNITNNYNFTSDQLDEVLDMISDAEVVNDDDDDDEQS